MPAPFEHQPQGLIEYLVKTTKSTDLRTAALESDNHYSAWIDPTLLNGFAPALGSMRSIQYRRDYRAGSLEFRGHVDVTNATTDTVAFIISEAFWPAHDSSYVIDVYNDGALVISSLLVDSTDGNVSVSWGATAGAWQTPTLINSWENAGAPYDDIGYRTGPSGLEFKGHITGGASGSIAFYLAAAYWPSKDLSTCTDVVGVATPGVAQIYVTASNGAVKVTQII